MSNRPYKELSDRFLKKASRIIEGVVHKPKSRESFNSMTERMLYNLHVYLTHHDSELDDIKNKKANGYNNWVNNLGDLRTSYATLYSLYNRIKDEELSIKRIENRAHLRALFFRILTTLGIGFSIMFVYYIAQKFGIHMPLLRVPG